MPRRPFGPICKRTPGGQVHVGTGTPNQKPQLDLLIGQCLMVWPPAEAEMALVLGHLLGADNAAALAVFQTLRRSSSQRDAISEAAKVKLNEQDQELLNAVLNVHKSIEAERNAIVHGHFGWYDKLDDGLLWMTSTSYVAIKAEHELIPGTKYDAARWKKVYDTMYFYKAEDFEEIFDAIRGLSTTWNIFRVYLGSESHIRAGLYRQLCDQPRIAQELVKFRQKNNPSTQPQQSQPNPGEKS
jgi:hypothetical protein